MKNLMKVTVSLKKLLFYLQIFKIIFSDENVEISCSSESSSSESEQEESDDVSSEGSSSDTNKPGNNPLLNSQDLTALGCIKLCCDWLRLNPEVLKLFSTNFRVFLGDFVKLLNIVVFDCKLMIRGKFVFFFFTLEY